MKRLLMSCLVAAILLPSSEAASQLPVPLGIAIRIGGGITRDGGDPGGLVSVDVGPFQGFAEFFSADGWRQANIGANLIVFELPLPIFRPFVGGGAGFTYNSVDTPNGGTRTNGRFMFDGLAGADLKLMDSLTFFGQVKYIFTLGEAPKIKDAVFQGGITFRIGL